jgi:glycosyltransferase involved in cell wall biosynthesis
MYNDLPNEIDLPLISIIIPSYNHGKYLQTAISSIKQQNYPAIEIIVVDDGSDDNTKTVCLENWSIKYVYQHNQGLSSARNTGIRHSNGDFLVFLDADDWLLENALQTNYHYIKQASDVAFVSGGHLKVYEDEGIVKESISYVQSDHYIKLLQGNYIGMHGAVMYRKWVFEKFTFDITLKSCEDYDLYLKIARIYPVIHHTNIIAAYRLHLDSMSSNIPSMLLNVFKVLDRQKNEVKNESEYKALRMGYKIWGKFYSSELYKRLITKKISPSPQALFTLVTYNPILVLKYFKKYIIDV